MSRVCILGIGSPSGDDQAGWLTVDALLASGVRERRGEVVIEKLDRPGASLISFLEDAAWVILVDAMRSDGQTGRIRHFDQTDWPVYSQGLSSHGLGVLDALSLAQALDTLPARLDLYGIEMGSATPGHEPGIEVQAAARRLASVLAAVLVPDSGRARQGAAGAMSASTAEAARLASSQQTEIKAMIHPFKVGDHVRWNSEAGVVSGRIIRVHTRDTVYKGHTRRCSPEDPQYEIQSDKTDHIAMHRGAALHRIA